MTTRTPLVRLAIPLAVCFCLFLAGTANAGETQPAPPNFTISKYGPSFVQPGQSVYWTIYLYNSSSIPLTIFPVDEGCSGLPESVSLGALAYQYIGCTTTAPNDDSTQVSNEVCATAENDGADIGVQHCSTGYSNIIRPALEVTKTVDLATADPFDTLHYHVTVQNTGDVDLWTQVTELGCDGAEVGSQTLDAGESMSFDCTHMFSSDDATAGKYVNTACADGYVQLQQAESALGTASPRSGDADVISCGSATTTLAKHHVDGVVFQDTNGNGARDDGEPGMAGVVVYADTNGNGVRDEGEPSTTTGDDGSYSLSLGLGKTTIREEVPGGFSCTLPAGCSYDVDLPANEAPPVLTRMVHARAVDPLGRDFGNKPPAAPAAQPEPAPAQAVLGARITPGTARIMGRTGCAGGVFRVRVVGGAIGRVVFSLDGNRIKTLHAPNRGNQFWVRVDPRRLRIGRHSVTALVTFKAKVRTHQKRLRTTFQRCAKQLVSPRFTG